MMCRPRLEREELSEVLVVALRAGQLMLESGANTARVEETIHHLGTGLGADWLDVVVAPGSIIISAVSHGEHRTRVQRVVNSGIDLARMAAVIDLSRRAAAGQVDRAETHAELERIATRPRVYGAGLTLTATTLSCACFAALQGGGIRVMIATMIAAAIAFEVRARLRRWHLGRLVGTSVTAAVGAGVALAVTRLLTAPGASAAILSAVLLLLPGALMVSAINDLFRGDTTPGMARLVTAVLHIIAIGTGIWVVLLLTGANLGPAPLRGPPYGLALGWSFLAAGGFAIAFDVPRHALFGAALTGTLANGTRLLAIALGAPAEAAMFLGGIVVVLVPEVLARRIKLPTSMFTIAGFIPLIPGTLAFRTVLAFVGRDYLTGTAEVAQVAVLTFALAAGMGTVAALARAREKPLWE